MSTNFNLGLNQSKNNVYCSNCGCLLSTNGEGFANALCVVCDAANNGIALSRDAVGAYMASLPKTNVDFIDMSGSGENDVERKTLDIEGRPVSFGERFFKALMPFNKKRTAAPNAASLEHVKSKQRTSIFDSPIGGGMSDIDEALKKDKK